MAFDALVANPGRLTILTALASSGRQEFVHLRRHSGLTDGNLASHAKRLHSGGLIDVEKEFRAGKPVTHYVLTPVGRQALEQHLHGVMAALRSSRPQPDPRDGDIAAIRDNEPSAMPRSIPADRDDVADDDWID